MVQHVDIILGMTHCGDVSQPAQYALHLNKPWQSDPATVGSVELGDILQGTALGRSSQSSGGSYLVSDCNKLRSPPRSRRESSDEERASSDESPSTAITTSNVQSPPASDSDTCDALLDELLSDATSASTNSDLAESADAILVSLDQSVDAPGFVKLSDFLKIKEMGLKSYGSAIHTSGRCKPCFFESRHLHDGGPQCFKGSLCEFCHEYHKKSKQVKKRGSRAGVLAARKKTSLSMCSTDFEEERHTSMSFTCSL